MIALPISDVMTPATGVSTPYGPAAITGAYGISALSLPNNNGAGVTVAIVDAYGDLNSSLVDSIQSDLQTFSTHFNLPYSSASSASPTLTEAFPDGTPSSYDPDWSTETALDVEWVHALAPAAHILLVISPDTGGGLYDGVNYAAAHAPIVSMSWGGSEFSDESSLDSEYFGATNVAYFVATGDDGEGTQYPSVSPNVTAIGGTSLSIGTGNVYSSESAWSGSGGGTASYESNALFQSPWISSGNREVPDASYVADPNTGVYVVVQGGHAQVGGTSLACPLWAATTALLDGNLSKPISESNLLALLYHYGDPTNLDSYFHDITTGGNGFNAGTGYDEVTGIGTPKANELLPAVVPIAPATVSATSGNAQATITWSASTPATSYNLYRGTASGSESSTPVKTGLTGTSVTDTGLVNGMTYYYKVAAVTPYCTSLLSSETTATPSNASASFLGTDASTQGSWKGVYGEDGWNVIDDSSGNDPSYPSYASVVAGSPAVNLWTGSSTAASSLQSAAIGSANRVAGEWYQSSWSMNVDVTGTHQIALYLLDYTNAGDSETITLKDSNTGITLDTRTASNFAGGVYYVWNITGNVTITLASTNSNPAVLSGIFFGTGSGSTAPPAASTLQGMPGDRSISLSWTASTGATSYNIYRGTASGGESATPIATGVTSTSYTDSGLESNTAYDYQVIAVNAVAGSPASNEASVTTLDTPPAPTATAAAGVQSVTVSWPTVAGATSYNVYRASTPGGEGVAPIVTGITGTSYTNSSRTPGVPLYYEVAAVNANGVGPNSAEVYATPLPVNPPANVAAQAATSQIILSWSAAPGATSYSVFRSTASGDEGSTPYAAGVTGTGYTDAGVTAGTMYYYKVESVSPLSASTQSTEVSATAGVPPVPSATATAGVQSVTVSWSTVAGATSYDVYRASTPGAEGSTPIATGITGTSYTNTNRTPGATLYYQVTAVNVDGQSAKSTEVHAMPLPVGPPANVTAIPGSEQITLNWSASPGATSYSVFRSTTTGGEGSTPFATGVTGTSYVNTGLTNGTKYYYKVEAVSALSTSTPSVEVSATVGTPPAPSATATAGVQQVTVSWAAVAGATSYNVYRAATSGGEGSTPIVTGTTATSYTNSNRTPGATLYYQVTAVDANGESPKSVEVHATPLSVAAPANVTATSGPSQVTLSWSASPGATSYSVFRTTTGGGEGSTPFATGVTGTSYVNTGVTDGTKYYYKVEALSALSISTPSIEVSATAGAPTAPIGVTATAGIGSVTVTWTAVSGATSYNVYRSSTPGGEGGTPIATGITGTFYKNSNRPAGATLYYQVTAVDADGEGARSVEVYATPLP